MACREICRQVTTLNGAVSHTVNVISAIPQGSCMGPIILFTDDITLCFVNCYKV